MVQKPVGLRDFGEHFLNGLIHETILSRHLFVAFLADMILIAERDCIKRSLSAKQGLIRSVSRSNKLVLSLPKETRMKAGVWVGKELPG